MHSQRTKARKEPMRCGVIRSGVPFEAQHDEPVTDRWSDLYDGLCGTCTWHASMM